jgi:hypothetical protein
MDCVHEFLNLYNLLDEHMRDVLQTDGRRRPLPSPGGSGLWNGRR